LYICKALDTILGIMSHFSSAARLEIREAWAGDSPLRGAARERLLDAAARCIIRDGLTSTGIAGVASEAGVSRPTVYRYFQDRHALVQATLLRAARSLGGRLAEHLRSFPSAARKAVEAELYVCGEVPRDPLLREVWNSTLLDAEMLADVTGETTLALAREALAGLEEAAGWGDAEAKEAVEFMLRLLLSLFVAKDPERSDDELRQFFERRLVPALGLVDECSG